jgi:sarcosine oxidase subunit gamma
MIELTVEAIDARARLGLKGPAAAQWLAARGIVAPAQANSWARSTDAGADELVVARLGTAEFFLEGAPPGRMRGLARALAEDPSGVYPVLREDWAFRLAGSGVHEVLAQVCNVDFAGLALDARPVIMTLMVGVAVLILPEAVGGGRTYRIWCDPTLGPYLSETLAEVVVENGGKITGVSA